MTQVPVETTVKGGSRATRCGRSEALKSWMPQKTGVPGSSPSRCASSGVIGPSRSKAERSGAVFARQPSRSTRLEKSLAAGFQRSVWQPSEVHLGRSHAGEPPSPVLRIGDEARGRERLRKALRLPEKLRAEIEPARQPRRKALREWRPDRIVFGGKFVGPRKLVVEHRERQPVALRIARDEHAGGAVSGDADRVDGVFPLHLGERIADEGPERGDVEMRVGAVLAHIVRGRAERDLVAVLGVDQRDLGVGLADVDDGDMAERLGHQRHRKRRVRVLAHLGGETPPLRAAVMA